jgi:hypothetical protein
VRTAASDGNPHVDVEQKVELCLAQLIWRIGFELGRQFLGARGLRRFGVSGYVRRRLLGSSGDAALRRRRITALAVIGVASTGDDRQAQPHKTPGQRRCSAFSKAHDTPSGHVPTLAGAPTLANAATRASFFRARGPILADADHALQRRLPKRWSDVSLRP